MKPVAGWQPEFRWQGASLNLLCFLIQVKNLGFINDNTFIFEKFLWL